MSNREIVIDLLSRLPEDAPLEEIAREFAGLFGEADALQLLEKPRSCAR